MIYLIQAGEDGPVKIGIAANPRRRLSHIQTSHWLPLRLAGVLHLRDPHEARLHEQFKEFHIRGEWFRPDPSIFAVFQPAGPEPELTEEVDGKRWPVIQRERETTFIRCPYCHGRHLHRDQDGVFRARCHSRKFYVLRSIHPRYGR